MRVTLEDVCEKGASNLKQSDVVSMTGEYPIYGAAGYLGNVDFYHQEKPYVAIVKDGAGIGRTTLHPAKSSVIGTMQYLLPKDNVLPEYLYYVVRHMHLEKYFTGATIPHIYFRDYKNEKFNLDSLDKQAEIVEILGKAELIILKRRQQLAELDKLIKARFVEMFGDVIRNSKSWEIRVLADIASSRLGKMLDTKQQTGECNYPYLANFNVQWFRFNTENLNQMDFNEEDRLNLNCRMATFWYARAVKLGVAPCGIMKYSPAFSRRLFTGYGVIVKLFTQIIWGGGLNTIVIMMGLRLLLEQKLP